MYTRKIKQAKRWKQDMSTKMKEEEVTETDRKGGGSHENGRGLWKE